MLAHENVASYLLDRGLLGPESVVDGDLAIRDVSSRNRNFRVETRDGPCYLLKQGVGPEAMATVAHEAAVYRHLIEIDARSRCALPAFHGFDAESGVLWLELVRNGEDLRTRHLRSRVFSPGPAAALGTALGELHRGTAAGGTVVGEPQGLAAEPPAGHDGAPWVLWMHRPSSAVFRDTSVAGLQLIRIVQGSHGFADALDLLHAAWRREALVHGDVKWDNCLVVTAGGREEIRLIDWETAALGDPAWDVGSALSQYLSFWLYSIPVTGAVAPERFGELAGFPLDAMKPALAACWLAYADALGVAAARRGELLDRVVRFAAARLLQTAFEAAQMSREMTSSLVLHLQLAFNLLQRPAQAATRLLGLSASGAGTR